MTKKIFFILLFLTGSPFFYSQNKPSKDQNEFTFKDAVKDPNYLELMHASEEEFQKLKKEAQNWPQEKFDKLVDWFVWEVDNQEAGGELRRLLVHLRPRAQKRLIEILNNKTHYDQLIKIVETEWLPQAPFHRVCYLIEDKPSENLIEPFSKFTKTNVYPIRSASYEVLAKIDSEKVIYLLKNALKDKDSIASNMLRELNFKLISKKIPTWEKQLFFSIQTFIDRKPDTPPEEQDPFADPFSNYESKENATKALFKINKKEAQKIFLSKKYLNLENKNLHDLLEILYQEKVLVDRGFLMNLIKNFKSKKLEYPDSYALREAICLLGRYQNPEDLKTINEIIELKDKEISKYGAYALMINKGLEEFDTKLWSTLEKEGYNKLNKYQKYYLACHLCNAEVNNGGFDQYFFNSYSQYWKDALTGFKEMEDYERYKILKAATNKFGKNGPSTDRNTRMDQLAEITNKDEKGVERYSGDYYSCKIPFEVRYAKFVIKNAKHFK